MNTHAGMREAATWLHAMADNIARYSAAQPSFWYLASPYSAHPGGPNAAFVIALDALALLTKARISVFSPIVHSHPIATVYPEIDGADHEIWLPLDRPFMEAACGCIILAAAGWNTSKGVKMETDYFHAAGKPVFCMIPGHLTEQLLAVLRHG